MDFNLIEQNIFFIGFFALAALVVWVCLDIFRFLRKEKKEYSLQKYFAANELFLRISEDFKKQLEKLIGKEIEKNIGEFKNEFQKTSEEIIKSYKSQFESENQEIQRVLSEFSQQITKETSNLSKFTLDTQNKISEEAKNKILELNQAAKKEFARIQEINLKTQKELSSELSQKFAKIYQSAKETLNKRVVETEKEIDNYKKERVEEMDRKIYQMLGEVAKKTLGKAIDLSTHEKLVIEALEKAKKEIF